VWTAPEYSEQRYYKYNGLEALCKQNVSVIADVGRLVILNSYENNIWDCSALGCSLMMAAATLGVTLSVIS